MKKFLQVFVLVTVLFQFSFSPNSVAAQTKLPPNTINITPAFQEVELSESSPQVETAITITNTSQQPLTIEVLPTSVDQQNLTGQITFERFSGAANQSYPYVSFSTDRFIVDPQSSTSVIVTVSNHSSLRPGGSYIGVLFRSTLDQPATDQVVLPAVASFLLINKQAGEVYNLSLTEVIGTPSSLSVGLPKTLGLLFTNEGNTHLQPRGTITLEGLGGRLLGQSTVNESSLYVLPQRNRLIKQELKMVQTALPIDFVTLLINGTSGEDRTPYVYTNTFVSVAPWFIGLLILSVIAIGLIFWIKKKLHQR